MARDIPDYMRGFDLNEDYGITTVSEKPNDDKPSIDPKTIDKQSME